MYFKNAIRITMADHDSHGDIIKITRVIEGERFNRENTYSLGLLTPSTQGRIARLMRAASIDITGGEIEFYIAKAKPMQTLGDIMADRKQRAEAERRFLAKLTGKTEAQIERDLTRKDGRGGA